MLLSMPSAVAVKKSALADYSELIHQIRGTLNAGKVRAQKAVERELVRTKWETGQLILKHILLNEGRAHYGDTVIQRLSKDLGSSDRELRYIVQFARTYPILPTSAKLGWGQYRELLSVNEEDKRQELAKRVTQKKLTVKQTRREINKLKDKQQITVANAPAPEVLKAIKPGALGCYAIFTEGGKKFRDLGFSFYQQVQGQSVVNLPEADLYTYEAEVKKVWDGDTFHALIDLGFGLFHEERLRLRRLDAPELMLRDGQEAQKVLAKVLRRASGSVVIKVSKRDDQYGRYLSDVWVQGQNIDQELLDSGFFSLRGG